MKKIIFFYLFLFPFVATSQNLSFGPVIGANYYDISLKGQVSGGDGGSYFNFGGFVDYKLNNRFGVKSQLIYTNSQESEYRYSEYNHIPYIFFSSSELKTLQLHALLKFDVRKDYDKGFYLVGGFRVTNVLDAKSDKDKDLSSFYEKTNFGALYGFGVTFLKNFSVELVGDYSLTNTITSANSEPKNYGCYFNLSYNLAPIFTKS